MKQDRRRLVAHILEIIAYCATFATVLYITHSQELEGWECILMSVALFLVFLPFDVWRWKKRKNSKDHKETNDHSDRIVHGLRIIFWILLLIVCVAVAIYIYLHKKVEGWGFALMAVLLFVDIIIQLWKEKINNSNDHNEMSDHSDMSNHNETSDHEIDEHNEPGTH